MSRTYEARRSFSSDLPSSAPLRLAPWARRKKSATCGSPPSIGVHLSRYPDARGTSAAIGEDGLDRKSLKQALVAIAVVAVAVAFAGCEPLSRDELAREVEGVGSLAAEGAVLADEVSQQETKRTFARVHARELADAAEHSAERLTDAHSAEGLADATQEAIHLSEDVSSAIGDLEVAPDDASGAAAIETRLRGLAQKASTLEDSL